MLLHIKQRDAPPSSLSPQGHGEISMLKTARVAEYRGGREMLQERRRPLRGHLSGLRVQRRHDLRPHKSGGSRGVCVCVCEPVGKNLDTV